MPHVTVDLVSSSPLLRGTNRPRGLAYGKRRLALELIGPTPGRRGGPFGPTTSAEAQVLVDAMHDVRRVRTHGEIPHGRSPTHIQMLLEGAAYRFRLLPDGRRQIVSLPLPGDVLGGWRPVLEYTVTAARPCVVAVFERGAFDMLLMTQARLARRIWRSVMVQHAISLEWIVNIGQRTAAERMAHLICEYYRRLVDLGLATGSSFELPLTQAELADCVGLSTVHANRTLQELRSSGMIVSSGKLIEIPDVGALERMAMFEPGYLSFDQGTE
jgi:CRP-like cAMP-binding protein